MCSADHFENIEKFPYLKTPNLSQEEKERLLARLKVESDELRDEFAILVHRTKMSLLNQCITGEKLKGLIEWSRASRLVALFEKGLNMDELFSKLRNHISFFDCEFLSLIIKGLCPELKNDLDEYKAALKSYCLRRVVEVPADAFQKGDADTCKLFVKCDKSFEDIVLQDIKDLQSRLSKLLKTDLCLLQVEDGCTELVFDAMSPVFLLTKAQQNQLSAMGILKVYNLLYQSTTALPEKTLSLSAAEITESEMEVVAHEIEVSKKVEKLAEAFEMTADLAEINGNVRILLQKWRKSAALKIIPERLHLMYHLASIGMQDLQIRYHEFVELSDLL